MDREAPEVHCARAVRHRQVHAVLALGLAACQKGYSGAFTTAANLLHELMEARVERRLRALQKDLNAVKLLIVDELGCVCSRLWSWPSSS
jgi:DNA replication protein DnaC